MAFVLYAVAAHSTGGLAGILGLSNVQVQIFSLLFS